MKIFLAVGAAGAMFASGAAQAACWTDTAIEAAQIRDFETRMMVSMLRCRIKGLDFTLVYNGFVRNNRALIDSANGDLRSQFARSVGTAGALGAYDNYMTKVANSYGAGDGNRTCEQSRDLLDTASRPGLSRALLLDAAVAAGSEPYLPGGRCGVSIAMRAK